MKKEYTIGLDIGTNSVGWAVIHPDLDLVKKKMKVLGNTKRKSIKKNFWGVRLFDPGETAENTRIKRTTRRRLRRRKYRLHELMKIFDHEMNKVDENFFRRLSESYLWEEDKSLEKHPIFGSLEEEIAYHESYPTIYHLRRDLIDKDKKFDLRLVYLALAHIVKYRGHFLIEGNLNTENSSISGTFERFLSSYREVFPEEEIAELTSNDLKEIETILSQRVTRSRKLEQLRGYFPNIKKTLLEELLKLILNLSAKIEKPLNLEGKLELKFSSESFENELSELVDLTDERFYDLFTQAKDVYDAIELSNILSQNDSETNAKLSSQMVQYYEDHKKDLAKLKSFIRTNLSDSYHEIFDDKSKNGYAGYIESKVSQEIFYDFIKKKIKNIDGSQYFLDLMDKELFLRKQRSVYNGVIPYQIHLEEFQRIINNQKKYYPFLGEQQAKLEKLVKFRIPYYVGPLAQGPGKFAWLERKSTEKIKPWNFEEVVNVDKSAVRFIQNLINEDMYLPGEKVLPKRSLIYQQFTIFNELTKVQFLDVRGKYCYLSKQAKLNIFENLFKKKNKVTEKDLIKLLENEYNLDGTKIKGLNDGAFTSNYSTYNDLCKIEGMKELLSSDEYLKDIEDIVMILTVFEDRVMRRRQLEKFSQLLSEKTLKELSRKHYTGWGRLSNRLINEIRDKESHKTILEYLIDDDIHEDRVRNRNFMQLINDDDLSFKEQIQEAQINEIDDEIESIVEDLPGSPAIKKGITQSIKIVDEIIDIMGYRPKNIVIEMARENQTTSQGKKASTQRLKKLEESLKSLGSDLLKKNLVKNEDLRKNRLYLYFLQNGKDIYTDKCLDIQQLSNYDIDHVIPQSFITDNSIDNIVLTSSTENRKKLDDVPSETVVKKQRLFWESLLKAGLMSERKFMNLTKAERGGLSKADKERFIHRQLVETRQITKRVAAILNERYNTQDEMSESETDKTKVILLKAALISQFRKQFGIYKIREANDYHHGHDAYLNAVIAVKLMQINPKLAPDLIYGEYRPYKLFSDNKATREKYRMTNLINRFEKEHIVDENGEILWSKSRDLTMIKKVMNYRQMNFVWKVEENQGEFYDQNIVSSSKTSKLRSIKNGVNPNRYGGYAKANPAYFVAVQYTGIKRNKEVIKNRIISIPIIDRKDFEDGPIKYLMSKGYANPKVLNKLKINTLFELSDGTRRLIFGAPAYLDDDRGTLAKANQMYLPISLYAFLYHLKRYDLAENPDSVQFVDEHHQCLDELINYIINFSKKYVDADTNLEKIIDSLNKALKEMSLNEIGKEINKIFEFTAVGSPRAFTFFDVKITKKEYRTMTNLWSADIIYQSITGLYETRINLGEESWDGEQ